MKKSAASTATTICRPRLATAMMFFPDIVPPISRHVVPPFVVSCKPLRGPPSLAKLLRFAAPAMTVLKVASSES